MGSLVKCGACSERCGARPIGVYWRWMTGTGRWRKYYARLCAACWASKVAPLDQDYSGDRRLTCPQCGIDTEDDYDGIYTTSFPGNGPALSTDSPFCDVHAADYRIWVMEFARDQELVEGAPEPPPQSEAGDATLRGLGRQVA